jgi:hypothetical protein
MTAPAWTPLAISVTSTVIALSAFIWQISRARLNQSIDLLFRLEADFFGKKESQRARAARNLLDNDANFKEMEDILDFFETIAMLTRKKALREYFVWHTFDYWIERYYAVSLPHIRACQSQDPSRWEDLDWLVPRLQRRKKKSRNYRLDPLELQRFLAEESTEG